MEVSPYLSGISWISSLLAADSYLLTAVPRAVSHSFLLINEKIPIVQNIKDFLSFCPAWELSALRLGLLQVGVKGASTAAHSCICVPLVGPCRPDICTYSTETRLSARAFIVEYDIHEPLQADRSTSTQGQKLFVLLFQGRSRTGCFVFARIQESCRDL